MKATKQDKGFASGVSFATMTLLGMSIDNTIIAIICFAMAIFVLIMQVITNERD